MYPVRFLSLNISILAMVLDSKGIPSAPLYTAVDTLRVFLGADRAAGFSPILKDHKVRFGISKKLKIILYLHHHCGHPLGLL